MFYQWYLDAMEDNKETCHCGNRYDPTRYEDRCPWCEQFACDGTPNCIIADENED